MKMLAVVLLFASAPLFMAQERVDRTNTVRHITAETCAELAPWYELFGDTCRQQIVVAVRQDPQGANGFLVSIDYTDVNGNNLSDIQFIAVLQPFSSDGKPSGNWPATARWYLDNIILNSVTISAVTTESSVTITDLH